MENTDLPAENSYADDLTWREQEVLILLSQRLTNQEIAGRLHLAESTVKDYVGRILSKLYVKNRRQAVDRARALGLLDPDRESVSKNASNLPTEPTPFVGRRDELATIRQLLVETRLLTLTGPGGIGKTRLALKAAEETAGDFSEGCFFVPLAPIRSVEHIIQSIAEAMRFPLATQEDPKHQLLRYLRKKQVLLVLDNFEHLLEGVGIVSQILSDDPDVKILTTSRQRLNLHSETILYVEGMAFPGPANIKDSLNYDAITLFLQSAKRVRPGFNPTPDEIEQITNICQIVQGMPLAIELAAAWLHILNTDEIADELKKNMDILVSEEHDIPDRHRSIRTVFDYSWSLLQQTEQEIFMRLSVFRGGFTRHAARQVTGASLQQLASLINKSFLSHDPVSGRLELHELLRQYAQEQLERDPDASLLTQEAHATYYAEFMHQRWGHLKGEKQMTALAEIEADIENVRTAWRYYLKHKDIPYLWMFIRSLWYVYWFKGWNHAGMELFAEAGRALQNENDDDAVTLRALAITYQSLFMGWLGLSEQGYALLEESVKTLQTLNNREALVFAYYSMGLNSYMLQRYTETIEISNKILEAATEIGDPWLVAFALFEVSMATLLKEDYPEARRLAEANLKLDEEIGDIIGSNMPLIILGHAALACGEYESAREYYLRCYKISQETGFHFGMQTVTKYLGKVSISLENIPAAETYLRLCLRITSDAGFVRDIVNLLYEYARLWALQGNIEQAIELLSFVIQHPASYEARFLEGRIRDSAKDLLSKIEDEVPQDIFTAALKRGQELELDEITIKLAGSKK